MKPFFRILCIILAFIPFTCLAQSQPDAAALLQDAAQLYRSGQYADAAAKYAEALKITPDDPPANYGMAVALFSQGKGDDAIPYLQKVTGAAAPLATRAYDILGNIYAMDHNSAKAIEAYEAAIKLGPADAQRYYNLGLVYFREKQYADAEKCAVESIKLDPKNAAPQRMYALVCFHQNKRANALLGLCSFILVLPNGPQVVEAYSNIQHILQGGALKAEPGASPMATDANTVALNSAITKAVADVAKQKQVAGGDLLTVQLTAIFNAVGPLADGQTGDDFFKKFYADYFYQLAQSSNMPAFARLVNQPTPESTEWIKNNAAAMQSLQDWVKATAR